MVFINTYSNLFLFCIMHTCAFSLDPLPPLGKDSYQMYAKLGDLAWTTAVSWQPPWGLP